jgi:ribosomal protein S18 acetylase RimI-like enzyme
MMLILRAHPEQYRWSFFTDPDEHQHSRRAAGTRFAADFRRHPNRYVAGRLPELPFAKACGAIKALDASHTEIKSMRVAPSHRQRGVASTLLQHILSEAKQRGFSRVSLETGSFECVVAACGGGVRA